MTKKEALSATLMVTVPDASLELALINAEINGSLTYTKADQEAIEKCAIPLLYGLFTDPDISEGDYSKSHPDFLRKIRERLLYLAKKYSVTEVLDALAATPTITSKSAW